MINEKQDKNDNNISHGDHENIKTDNSDQNIFWFSSESKYGQLNIGIFKSVNIENKNNYHSSTVLEMVKLIQREEQIIQIVEDWLGSGVYLKPINEISTTSHSVTLSLRDKTANDNYGKLILAFKDQAINTIPSPNETINENIIIQTSFLPAKLQLSELTINKEQLDTIQPGNILLIRESFISPWVVKAISKMHMDRVAVGLIDTDNRTFHTYKGDHQQSEKAEMNSNINNDRTYRITIAINDSVFLPFSLLFKWINDGSYMLAKPLINYKIEIWNEDTLIACGHLLSLSNGYGVFIDNVTQ
jgi:hypothetical protein